MGQTLRKNKSGKIKSLRLSTTKRWMYLTLGSILLLISTLYFVVYVGLFSPGVAGIAQGFAYSLWSLLGRINPDHFNGKGNEVHLGMELQQFKIILFYSIYVFMNIPIFIFTYQKFGKRFLVESTYTLFFVSFFGIVLSFTAIGDGSISFIGDPSQLFPEAEDGVPNPDQIRTIQFVLFSIMALFAGILYGLGVGIVLSVGACTMGFDPYGRYYARTTGVEIGKLFFMFSFAVSFFWLFVEFLILNVANPAVDFTFVLFMNEVFFSPRLVATIIFLFVYSFMVGSLYPSSRKYIIEVTSQKTKQISEYFNLINYHKSHTLIEAKGGYSGKNMEIFKMVVNAEELIDVVEDIATIDPVSFIDVIEAKKVYGPQNWIPNTKEDRRVQAELHRRRDRKRAEHEKNVTAFKAGNLKQQRSEKEFIRKQKREANKKAKVETTKKVDKSSSLRKKVHFEKLKKLIYGEFKGNKNNSSKDNK